MYYILIVFLMLSVTLLPMLMTPPSILKLISLLVCYNSWSWFLNLTYETQWTGVRSGSLISILGKVNLIDLTVLQHVNWVGLHLMENHLLRCWDCIFFLIFIRALTLSSLLKLPIKTVEHWFLLWSLFLLSLHLISINFRYSLA